MVERADVVIAIALLVDGVLRRRGWEFLLKNVS